MKGFIHTNDYHLFMMSAYPIWNAHIIIVDLIAGYHVTDMWWPL